MKSPLRFRPVDMRLSGGGAFSAASVGLGQMATLATVIMIVLKLDDRIEWSWWWVFAPVIVVLVISILAVAGAVVWILRANAKLKGTR